MSSRQMSVGSLSPLLVADGFDVINRGRIVCSAPLSLPAPHWA